MTSKERILARIHQEDINEALSPRYDSPQPLEIRHKSLKSPFESYNNPAEAREIWQEYSRSMSSPKIYDKARDILDDCKDPVALDVRLHLLLLSFENSRFWTTLPRIAQHQSKYAGQPGYADRDLHDAGIIQGRIGIPLTFEYERESRMRRTRSPISL